jgi:glutamate synthase (NADPH) small chain
MNMKKEVSTHPSDIDYAKKCIPCQRACPALTDVPGYIEAIYEQNFDEAFSINRRANLFPGILGRICTRPCEAACRHGDIDLGEPIEICHLKRFCSDHKSPYQTVSETLFPRTGKSIAIVGAGPAGLAAAHSLAVFGHDVTIYEAMPKNGGMLEYGIPPFRLPRQIVDSEIAGITRLGIRLERGFKVGKDIPLQDLLGRHDATVLAAGCYEPRKLDCPGEDLPGVLSGLDFMMLVNRGSFPAIGKRVIIIGGGFTAIDCARSSKRLGADEVFICIRNVEEELTIPQHEILDTKREGITFLSLVSLSEIDGRDHVERAHFKRNRFGGMRNSSGRAIVPIPGSDFNVPADTVIAAIGQTPSKSIFPPDFPAEIRFNCSTGACKVPGLFAAGDYLHGASTVIQSIGSARNVAVSVDTYLMGKQRRFEVVAIESASDTHRKRSWDFIPNHPMPVLDLKDRFSSFGSEVEQGLPAAAGLEASQRCYLCNLRYEIDVARCIYCRLCLEVCPRDCIELIRSIDAPSEIVSPGLTATTKWNETAGIVIDSSRCIRCGECLRACPTLCISVSRITLLESLASYVEPDLERESC